MDLQWFIHYKPGLIISQGQLQVQYYGEEAAAFRSRGCRSDESTPAEVPAAC